MREFKTILCPIDFSEASYRALEYGLRFARQSEATIILMHVLHNPSDEFFHPEGYVIGWDQAKAKAKGLLEDTCSKRLGGYAKTEVLVDIGDPHELIVNLARDRRVDLIVTSTHGRTGLAHMVMGSVAEKVIRHAPCPVFVVRQNGD
ncbi:MAG: universal stress protein [Deltaproteobacteria bacterium]|nr:universal stress protein [Deltaproteobacteria bacterium]